MGQLLGMYHTRVAYPQNTVVELESRRAAERRRRRRLGLVTRALYIGPWRVDLTVRDGVVSPGPGGGAWPGPSRAALEAAGAPSPASIGLILSDDAELAELNAAHLGHQGPTDVLSFPLSPSPDFPLPPGRRPHLGDIVVSVERAAEQAEAGRGGQTGDVRWSAADELRLLVTHGALHICGLDHAEPAEEAAMRALERRLLAATSPRLKPPATIAAGPPGAGSGPVVLSAEGRLKVVVGLGNPGSQYAGTRHNVGWLVMDRLAERAGWTGKGRQRDASNVAMGRFRGLDLTLVKPLTYMNDSGLAVRKVIAREHAPLVGPARRRRRLRAAVRQAALPRGRRCRAATTAWARSSRSSGPRSSAGSGSASASRTATPSTTS